MGFINKKHNGITAETTVYTPTGVTGTVIGFTITPVDDSDAVIAVKLDTTHIVKNLTVTNGTTMVIVGGEQKLVVADGEPVKVSSNTAVDVVLSILEA